MPLDVRLSTLGHQTTPFQMGRPLGCPADVISITGKGLTLIVALYLGSMISG
jgi:hypothetical protein